MAPSLLGTGNARLQGLEKDLKMAGDQYNLALVSTNLLT